MSLEFLPGEILMEAQQNMGVGGKDHSGGVGLEKEGDGGF